MATEFLMPKLGLTMEEGTITEWLVDDGAEIEAGTAVLRIETDKTETEVEASSSGRLHAVAAVGDTYACGELIGWFLADGEAPPTPGGAPATASAVTAPPTTTAGAAPPTTAVAATSGGRLLASPNARRIAAERGIDLAGVRGTGPGGRIVSEDLDGVAAAPSPAPARSAPSPVVPGSAPPATVAARQLADLLGIDLATVPPDPVDRRITRDAVALHVRDLLSAPERHARPAGDAATERSLLPATQSPTEVIPLAGMRGTIADRMHRSLQQMAQLTLFMDVDVGVVVADRSAREEAGDLVPGYTDYVVAAVARALVRHPRVNSQVVDDGIALLPDVHVGVAVALDDGLVVPVVRDTCHHDLAALSAETSRLARAARNRTLELADLEGGTFSVSTLGMFGVDGFTPVINPPNVAILGVGRLREDVVVRDGVASTVPRMTLSLTWDHRVLDGAPAAEFCRTISELLQRPADLDTPS